MKKIVPFKHEAKFKTKISEVTSISLEHTLHKEDGGITGEFIVSGDYKMNDTSTSTEYFSLNLPFDIVLDEKYNIDDALIDINDFYYEILNDDKLIINIEVVIDKIVERLIEVKKQVITLEPEIEEELEVKEQDKVEESRIEESVSESSVSSLSESSSEVSEIFKEDKEVEEVVENLMSVTNKETEYTTYHIHIVRDGDTLDEILEKYSVSQELLSYYNNLSELKIGDKLLIPANESN